MEPKKKKSVRLWAVVFWLLVWQGTSMALTALYPHGALLLASPLSALARLGELAVTAAFWQTALTSTVHILGGFLLACVLAVVARCARRAVPPCRGAARAACVRCQGRAGRVVHHPRARVA